MLEEWPLSDAILKCVHDRTMTENMSHAQHFGVWPSLKTSHDIVLIYEHGRFGNPDEYIAKKLKLEMVVFSQRSTQMEKHTVYVMQRC